MGCAWALLFAAGQVLAQGMSVSLDPSYAQRLPGGKVRVHIVLSGAQDLLSMGVKVSFDPDVLQVASAEKNTSVWRFAELEPEPEAYLPEVEVDNENGTVTMIGGRLKPGVSGQVLLGWIVFDCVGGGQAQVMVGPARPAPYDNFVSEDGTVHDANITFSGATVCVTDDACEGDLDGDRDVDSDDMDVFRAAFGAVAGSPAYNPACDLDADGDVDADDLDVLRVDFGRANCPACAE